MTTSRKDPHGRRWPLSRPEPAPPDPDLWEVPEVRALLAERDIGALFAVLQRHGLSQRRIAALVGMSQSEISEVLGGRKVAAYDVLLRIALGLAIPLPYMGLMRPPPLRERALTEPELDQESGCARLRHSVVALAGTGYPSGGHGDSVGSCFDMTIRLTGTFAQAPPPLVELLAAALAQQGAADGRPAIATDLAAVVAEPAAGMGNAKPDATDDELSRS
jgi:transcriptional regulator with XRE-family HTH domain